MNQMDEEKYLKTFKKDELIKRVIKLEEELAKCESDLAEYKTKANECSTQLLEHQVYKKEVETWTFGLVKTLLENEDNRKLFASQLEENINLIIDARVQEKLATKTDYYDSDEGGGSSTSIIYDGCEINEIDGCRPW